MLIAYNVTLFAIASSFFILSLLRINPFAKMLFSGLSMTMFFILMFTYTDTEIINDQLVNSTTLYNYANVSTPTTWTWQLDNITVTNTYNSTITNYYQGGIYIWLYACLGIVGLINFIKTGFEMVNVKI